MSAVEYVSYTGELVGMPPKDAMTRAHEVLDYVGLSDERYRLVHTYSTGMRQRVKLAQAIVHDPELLLLDEPTNGLDPRGRELMLELVRDLRASGMSIIYSSHLLADVERDDVLILSHGRVLAQGKVEELLKGAEGAYELTVRREPAPFLEALAEEGLTHTQVRPDRFRVKLETAEEGPGDPISHRVFRAAQKAGVQVRSLRPLRATLEDVFIDALEGAGSPE
jgi:ABC-2 type transport system ATP-binding protein